MSYTQEELEKASAEGRLVASVIMVGDDGRASATFPLLASDMATIKSHEDGSQTLMLKLTKRQARWIASTLRQCDRPECKASGARED